MNDVMINAGALPVIEGGSRAGGPPPTEAQIARFQDQLQQPPDPSSGTTSASAAPPSALPAAIANVPAVYGLPSAQAIDRADFRPLVDYASRTSDSLRGLMQPMDIQAASAVAPELTPLIESIARANATTMATMHFNLIAETVQSASRNVHTLYQQQG